MDELRPPSELVRELERLLGAMHTEAPAPTDAQRRLGTLTAVISKLSEPRKAHAAKCPPDYVELWNLVGVSGASELPNRAIRYLSWETDVAVTPEFQTIALLPDRLSARSLQGLIRSAHRRWKTVVHTQSLGNLVVATTTYTGRNSLIQRWKRGIQRVLHAEGPKLFAWEIARTGETWEKLADSWGLEADSEFGREVLEQSVSICASTNDATVEDYVRNILGAVLKSPHWQPAGFKVAIQKLILASPRFNPSNIDKLKDLILTDGRLLDPRLPANATNWLGVSDSARDIVIQWLSAEDIELFFDHVLPTRSDPHGRKPFWMRYKSRVKRSRPLLAYLDVSRWQANQATKSKRNYGRMDDSCDTSAFLLDFGAVLVVEFSKVGNAVFVYRHRDVPGLLDTFWSNARFHLRDLKQPGNCVERITHTLHWHTKMRQLLAQFGIHPGA